MLCLSFCKESLVLLLVFCGCFYWYITRNYNFFKKRGIKCTKPLPLVGNMGQMVLLKDHFMHVVKKNYDKYPGEKYIGMFSYSSPIIVIKDLKLIKQILVKDFYNFTDRQQIVGEEDLVLFHSLYYLKGERWREMRTILSPMFTNSLMESMEDIMTRCVVNFTDDLKRRCDEDRVLEIFVKDIMSKFTVDVVALYAFGIDGTTSSLNDSNDDIYKIVKETLNLEGINSIIADMVSRNPILKSILGGRYTNKKFENFYRKIVSNVMEERNQTGVVKKNVIHLVMSAMSGRFQDEDVRLNDDMGYVQDEDDHATLPNKNVWTEEEIIAQPVMCLIAGYEFSLTLLNFITYSLAVNPLVQHKLREEIDNYIKEHNCMIRNSDIGNLKYMDMVILETLRIWTPLPNIDRVCTNSYTLPPSNPNNKEFEIKKGQIIWIPVHSIHMDPQYYPEPEKFIPERFSKQNRSQMDPMTFLTFGAGQRCCPGSHLTMMEVKMLIFHLLANFIITKTSKTESDLKIKSHLFSLDPTNPIHLGLLRRTDAPNVAF